MTKNEFVKAVAERAEFTQKDVKTMLDALQDVVYDVVKAEDSVRIIDGLTVTSAVRAARVARNPRTGEAVNVPEKRVPRVKIGNQLKAVFA